VSTSDEIVQFAFTEESQANRKYLFLAEEAGAGVMKTVTRSPGPLVNMSVTRILLFEIRLSR